MQRSGQTDESAGTVIGVMSTTNLNFEHEFQISVHDRDAALARSVAGVVQIGRTTTTLRKGATSMNKSKSSPKAKKEGTEVASASQLIDAKISELGDWRGETLARVRMLVKQAVPDVVEEWKWSVPVWSHAGIICTGETYKKAVKLTFARGASLEDPSGLFNSSLEGNTRRAIDFHEGDKIDEKALKALIRAASALNSSSAR